MSMARKVNVSDNGTPLSSVVCRLEADFLPVFVPFVFDDVAWSKVFFRIIRHSFSLQLFDSPRGHLQEGRFWNSKVALGTLFSDIRNTCRVHLVRLFWMTVSLDRPNLP